MKLLLDECVPRRLKDEFDDFDILTVREAGFSGLKNGELLRAAQGKFDALITVDKNLTHQQNLTELTIAVVVLSAVTNRYESLAPLVPRVQKQLRVIEAGQVVTVTQ